MYPCAAGRPRKTGASTRNRCEISGFRAVWSSSRNRFDECTHEALAQGHSTEWVEECASLLERSRSIRRIGSRNESSPKSWRPVVAFRSGDQGILAEGNPADARALRDPPGADRSREPECRKLRGELETHSSENFTTRVSWLRVPIGADPAEAHRSLRMARGFDPVVGARVTVSETTIRTEPSSR